MSNNDFDFQINEAYLPYVFNADNTDLVCDEEEQIDAFLSELHIDEVELLYNGEDLNKSFTRCDITGEYCMSVRVRCFAYLDSKLQRIS